MSTSEEKKGHVTMTVALWGRLVLDVVNDVAY